MPVRHKEQVDALLEGLPSDYAPVVSRIENKKCPPSIAEIEALLYEHETHLNRYAQESQNVVSPSLNYTQASLGCGRGSSRSTSGSSFGGGNFGRGCSGKFAIF